MILNSDITVLNKRILADHSELFIPTVIYGVHWYAVKSVGQTDSFGLPDISAVIRIPYAATVENGRKYIREEEYNNLNDDEMDGYWSLQRNLYIARGAFKDVSGISDLLETGADVVTIVEYADNTERGSDAMKHWRIGGRNQ